MPVIIKKMRVVTTVEKQSEVHENLEEILYDRLKADIWEMLASGQENKTVNNKKRER